MSYKILHASDLHFGTTQPTIVNALSAAIILQKPDLVILSGDFTQSGRRREFREAQDFIAAIKQPVFVIPGNHDFPRFNPLELFIKPYRRYRRFISDDLCPVYQDDILGIVGLNTARPFQLRTNWAQGRVSKNQLSLIEERLNAIPPGKFRLFVCHHPLMEIADTPLNVQTTNAAALLDVLYRTKVDLVFTGHVHHASVTVAHAPGGTDQDHKVTFVGASTATSSRLRVQANGFNLIYLGETIDVDLYHFEKDAFLKANTRSIPRKT